jgi:hypothetical protein
MTKDELFAIDPDAFRGPKDPPFLEGSYAEERQGLTGHVIRDLRDHPQTERNRITGRILVNPHGLWEWVRALPVRADGLTVEQLFKRRGDAPLLRLRELADWLFGACDRHRELLLQVEQWGAVARAVGEPTDEAVRAQAVAEHRRLSKAAL